MSCLIAKFRTTSSPWLGWPSLVRFDDSLHHHGLLLRRCLCSSAHMPKKGQNQQLEFHSTRFHCTWHYAPALMHHFTVWFFFLDQSVSWTTVLFFTRVRWQPVPFRLRLRHHRCFLLGRARSDHFVFCGRRPIMLLSPTRCW